MTWHQGGSEKEIYAPEEGADTGLFASVLQVAIIKMIYSDEHLENITEPKTFNLFCANHYLILIIFKTVSNWILLQAYKNHWVLRTSPDDWFFPVIRRIAQVRSSQMYIQRENTLNCKVVDDNALHPEVQKYLGRGQPVLGLKVTRLPSSSYIDQNQ